MDEDEEIELPRFECRLPIPDEITGADRMLLQQVDILRQEIAFVHKKGVLGRRAWALAKKNEKDLKFFQRLYWIATGFILAVELYFKFVK